MIVYPMGFDPRKNLNVSTSSTSYTNQGGLLMVCCRATIVPDGAQAIRLTTEMSPPTAAGGQMSVAIIGGTATGVTGNRGISATFIVPSQCTWDITTNLGGNTSQVNERQEIWV